MEKQNLIKEKKDLEKEVEHLSKQLKETTGENMLKNAIYVIDQANERREKIEQENKENETKLKKEPTCGAQNNKTQSHNNYFSNKKT